MKKLLLLLLSVVPVITYAQGEALIVSSSNISFDSAAAFTKIKEIKLDGLSNKTEWETQSIPAGVYIYELKNGNTSIDVGRIVITK